MILFLLFVVFSASAGECTKEKPVVITCGMVAHEYATCKAGVALWEKETGNKAKVIQAPNGSNERLGTWQQHLAAQSSDIDVYQVDTVWPGLLADHFVDLSPHIDTSPYLPQIIQNNTVNGRLVAMPWFIQVGILYYRKDLLDKYGFSVPKTWDDLEVIAKAILSREKAHGNDTLWGYVFQGKAYEGLTCNALEWVNSYPGGGTIVNSDGNVTLYNKNAIKAIKKAAEWIGTIAPKGVLNYEQEDCRGVFQTGKSVFMRNWPYAWILLQQKDSPVRDKVGIAPLPHGGKASAGTLGGWNLAVSKYSKNQEKAIDLVRFLTSKQELVRRAVSGGYFPAILEIYSLKEFHEKAPLAPLMIDMLHGATARPSSPTGRKYSQVSSIFWNAVHDVLSGKKTSDTALNKATKRLNQLSRNGKRWHRI